jgi:prepilin-type N-terminal cleavage/methylation domain-containing protein
MKTRMRKGGFTLIELMTVVIIVGILAIVAIPLYRGQILRAKVSEGKALMGSVRTGQLVYFAEHNSYLAVTETSYDSTLGVDASLNKYFKTYSSTGGNAFTATTKATIDSTAVTVTIDNTGAITTTPAGL